MVGGLVAYLWLSSDSIMEEMKQKRPQVTIKVVPRRRAQHAETAAKPAEIAKPAAKAEAASAPEAAAPAPGKEAAEKPAAPAAPVGAPESKTAEAAAGPAKEAATEAGKGSPPEPQEVTLHPNPDPKLVEKSDQGPLPKIDEAGRRPWRVYSRPFNPIDERPRMAVVITQLGLSPALTQEAIADLPPAVTLGFAPYAKGLADWIRQAREKGHEVLIGLPMEPQDYPRNDPGPYGLMLSNSPEENMKRLNWNLSRFTGYVGVFNFMGSRFTVDKAAVKPVLEQLHKRGLLVLDTRATPFSIIGSVAKEIGMPYAIIDISADAEPNLGFIDHRLAELQEAAVRNKAAIAIIHPYPITMLRVKRWVGRLDAKKVVLAPLSAVVQRPKSAP